MRTLYFNEKDAVLREKELRQQFWRMTEEEYLKVAKKRLEQALSIEFAEGMGAQPYERSSQRRGYRGGYRYRDLMTWGGKLLLRMHQFIAKQPAGAACPTPNELAPWLKRYADLLRRGRWANPTARRFPGAPSRVKQTKGHNLVARLERYQQHVLAFLHDFSVPFTNNQAEQDVRMIKVQQKISGTFRTLSGAQKFARIRSYLSTARKQQRDVFKSMVNLFAGRPFMPRATAQSPPHPLPQPACALAPSVFGTSAMALPERVAQFAT